MKTMRGSAIGLAAMSMIAAPAAADRAVETTGKPRGVRHNPARGRSEYMPHQGEREVARRLRQQQRDANRQCDRADALGVEGGRVSRRGRVVSVLRIAKEGSA